MAPPFVKVATKKSFVLPREQWWPFIIMGMGIPVHIVVGLCGTPYLLYIFYSALVVVCKVVLPPVLGPNTHHHEEEEDFNKFSTSCWILFFFALYCVSYFQPAQSSYPGWKGHNWFWHDFADYANTGRNYSGTFEIRSMTRDLVRTKETEKGGPAPDTNNRATSRGKGRGATCDLDFEHAGGSTSRNELDPDGQYVLAAHPHGIIIQARTLWRAKNRLEEFLNREWRMIGASVLFRIPLIRELSLSYGAVDATKATCELVLKNGANLIVYPGGLDEANALKSTSCSSSSHFSAQNGCREMEKNVDGGRERTGKSRTGHGCFDEADETSHEMKASSSCSTSSSSTSSETMYLKPRRGFVRLAVRYGIPVVPVFVFGELDCVDAVPLLPRPVQEFLQKNFRISTTWFTGRWGMFIPKRVPFMICLGKPIEITSTSKRNVVGVENKCSALGSDGKQAKKAMQDEAEEAEVERVYEAYKAGIVEVFEHYKLEAHGYEKRTIEFLP
ncbi:unnamed protein product [Amoebophrya sp. A25]|nr:unnamed protein product [Amoebophrya sp. A25]|eukprot:GSA25T00015207001.1